MTYSKYNFFPGKSRKFDVHKKKMFLFIRWLLKADSTENEQERNKSADIFT